MPIARVAHAIAFLAVYCLTLTASFAFSSLTSPQLMAALVLMLPLIWLTITDLAKATIPDGASASVAIVGAVYHLQTDSAALLINLPMAALLLGALWLAGEVYWRKTSTEALGIGDAKLIAAGTLCVSEMIWLALVMASFGGIIAVFLSRIRDDGQQSAVPFGPFLAYAIFTTFLLSGSQ